MRIVIQRVSEASVFIEEKQKAKIGHGLVILLGIEPNDTIEDIQWMCKKISNLRIFPDQDGIMNRSILDSDGEIITISQFTLYASTKKGNRPSYIRAARPDIAIPLYEKFIEILHNTAQRPVQTGEFGTDMKLALVNDGPVTIIIDSKTENNDFTASPGKSR